MKNNTNMSHLQENRLWQEVENWLGDRLTIEPRTFCYLKEIELKTMKIQ